jgi:EpsD family peptidyl-prolyl cis-trans isomerase
MTARVRIEQGAVDGSKGTRVMTDSARGWRRTALSASALALLAALAACGAKKHEATQAAARVDGAEITVHQINYRLQRERGLKPEQMDGASRKVLEQLIDEQLIVAKAEKEKVDKDPGAEQAIAAARREILARAYIEQSAQGVQAPAEDAVHRYYDDNDALFSKRRVYTMQEFLAQMPREKMPAVQAMVEAGRPVSDIEAWFKARNVPFRGQQGVHAAEQIPLGSLKALAAIPDGRGLFEASPTQVHVTYILASTIKPVSFDQAKAAISQFLLTDARRKATESNIAALRGAAKFEYRAPYESLGASGATFGLKDVKADPVADVASGTRVSLPQSGAASGVQISLPNAPSEGVRVELPAAAATSGVRVSLPTAASGVEVRLPDQIGADGAKK